MAFYPVPPAVPPVPRFKRHHATRPMELDDLGHEGSECMLKASASHPVISPCIDASSSKLKPKGESVQGGRTPCESSEDVNDMPTAMTAREGGSSAIHWRRLKRGFQEGAVHDHFIWSEEDELGRGSFGRVFRGKSCYDSKKFVAIKQMARSSIGDVDQLWSEINILADLDHPNILRFLEAYEDRCSFYIVTEACLGGNLLEWIDQLKGQEVVICRIAQEATGVLAHCHSRNVCHRDLKLENILFLRRSLYSPIRVADFGLSKQCSVHIVSKRLQWSTARAAAIGGDSLEVPKPRSIARAPTSDGLESPVLRRNPKQLIKIRSVAGTPEYMAPEVINILNQEMANPACDVNSFPDFYDLRCDVWSLGVCLHTLLEGNLPYEMEDMSKFIAEGVPLPKLQSSASPLASDFVKHCLLVDFRVRPAARSLLKHRWFAESCVSCGPTPHSSSTIASRLRAFSKLSKFKRAALLAAARHLGSYEHEELRRIFEKVDIHHQGEVPLTDLMEYLAFAPASPSSGHQWVAEAVSVLDAQCKGTIAYTEFLAAIMDHHIEERKDLALAAFRGFDVDGSGTITSKEMERVIEDCDCELRDALDDEAELDFEKFMKLLKSG
eukprot:symbB.v1.2.026352.t1/scaffold2626.1/size122458/2